MSIRKGGQLIAGSVNPEDYAKTDLSNLDATGQAKFDAKANTDFSNCDLSTVHCVVKTYKNGSSWYRVYDDGWVEQGGIGNCPGTDSNTTFSFLKSFIDANYGLLVTENGATINSQASGSLTCVKNTRTFVLYNNGYGYSGHTVGWFACGYGA